MEPVCIARETGRLLHQKLAEVAAVQVDVTNKRVPVQDAAATVTFVIIVAAALRR